MWIGTERVLTKGYTISRESRCRCQAGWSEASLCKDGHEVSEAWMGFTPGANDGETCAKVYVYMCAGVYGQAGRVRVRVYVCIHVCVRGRQLSAIVYTVCVCAYAVRLTGVSCLGCGYWQTRLRWSFHTRAICRVDCGLVRVSM